MKNNLIVCAVAALVVMAAWTMATPVPVVANASIGGPYSVPSDATLAKVGDWCQQVVNSVFKSSLTMPFYAKEEVDEAEAAAEADEATDEKKEEEPDTSIERIWSVAKYA